MKFGSKFGGMMSVAAIIQLAAFSGCGDDSDDKADRIEDQVELAGNWDSDCAAFTQMKLSSLRSEFDFDALGGFEKKEEYFAQGDCEGQALALRTVGTYKTNEPQEDDADHRSVTFIIEDAFLNLESDAAAKLANRVRFCGRNDWKAGEEVEVTGDRCEALGIQNGDRVEDIFVIEDGNLYFGQKSVFNLSGDERPDAVDFDVIFRKD